ncbi:MAG: antibiotic biosynthesis monooxygenase [Acidimicrobiia bacterium]|jgi:heme-degrading monooxygenase HmoA
MATNAAVARIWHGWTTVDNADAYQSIVEGEVFPAIFERRISGLQSAQLMRADDVVDGEVEFTTIIWFESLDSVKNFMGEDYRRAHMPENARAVLKRFDAEAKHFHIFGSFAQPSRVSGGK